MKILYLYPRQLYDTKMSIGRALHGEAVNAVSGIEVRMWGLGWDGYRQDDRLSANIDRLGWYPDWLWIYKGEGLRGVDQCPTPKVIVFNEANHQKTLDEIVDADADVAIFHHAGDMDEWADDASNRIRFSNRRFCFSNRRFCRAYHIPHAAPDWSDPFKHKRTTSALLTGVLSPEIYPLRSRFAALIHSGQIDGDIRKHPGYRLPDRQFIDRQFRAYEAKLASHEIALCCTSKYKYLLAKIIEAAMAGCLVATDYALDPWFELLAPHCIQIDPDWDDQIIADTIRWWQDHDEDRRQKAKELHAVARGHFTMEHWATRFIQILMSHTV